MLREAARGKGRPRHGRRVAMRERGGEGERRLEAAAPATYMIFWQMQLTSSWSSSNPAVSQSADLIQLPWSCS